MEKGKRINVEGKPESEQLAIWKSLQEKGYSCRWVAPNVILARPKSRGR